MPLIPLETDLWKLVTSLPCAASLGTRSYPILQPLQCPLTFLFQLIHPGCPCIWPSVFLHPFRRNPLQCPSPRRAPTRLEHLPIPHQAGNRLNTNSPSASHTHLQHSGEILHCTWRSIPSWPRGLLVMSQCSVRSSPRTVRSNYLSSCHLY